MDFFDFTFEHLHGGVGKPFTDFQGDIADKTVADNNINISLVDVTTLHITYEIQLAGGKQFVRLLDQRIPLTRLLADAEQTDARPVNLQDLADA